MLDHSLPDAHSSGRARRGAGCVVATTVSAAVASTVSTSVSAAVSASGLGGLGRRVGGGKLGGMWGAGRGVVVDGGHIWGSQGLGKRESKLELVDEELSSLGSRVSAKRTAGTQQRESALLLDREGGLLLLEEEGLNVAFVDLLSFQGPGVGHELLSSDSLEAVRLEEKTEHLSRARAEPGRKGLEATEGARKNEAALSIKEGHAIGEHSKEGDAEGPHVGTSTVVLLALQDLRGNIVRGSAGGAEEGILGELRAEAKVGELDGGVVAREKEVLELEVSVGNSVGVAVGKSGENLPKEELDLGLGEAFLLRGHEVEEVSSLQKLHDDENGGLGLEDLVDLCDVGVSHLRVNGNLSSEGAAFGILRQFGEVNNLHGRLHTGRSVGAFSNDAVRTVSHSSAENPLSDFCGGESRGSVSISSSHSFVCFGSINKRRVGRVFAG